MRDLRNMTENERTIVVNTSELLATLQKNREDHNKEYQEAVNGYLETARKELTLQYEKAKSEVDKAFKRTTAELEQFDPSVVQDTIVFCRAVQFTLTAPRNFLDAYDQAIQMMDWEVRETVELTTTEFRCFVMNKWDWMEDFKKISATYRK